MKRKFLAGTTSLIDRIFIRNTSSTGAVTGLTGLVASSAGLTLSWIRIGDTSTTSTALSAGTLGTWSSGGFKEIDSTKMPGQYELGIPNAAVSTGFTGVNFHLRGAANMEDIPFEYELDQINYQDSQRAGLLALPSTGTLTVNPVLAGTQTFNNTGTWTGNLTGSVGSVTGAVGSVTGSVGSVAGNVGGNVVGSVGSVAGNVGGNVVGSVGSVAGNVGGNVVGSVASVTGAVGSVTGAVTVGAYSAGEDPFTLVMAGALEGSSTFKQCTRVMLSALAGKLSGASTTTVTIRDINDTTNRIVATVDASGDRTAVTLNGN